jgi:hypothetical protein
MISKQNEALKCVFPSPVCRFQRISERLRIENRVLLKILGSGGSPNRHGD